MTDPVPVLGLLVAPDAPEGVLSLLRSLRPWCDPRALDPGAEPPAAWLATSVRATGLTRALRSGRPVAVWAQTPEDLDALGDRRAEVAAVVSDDPRVTDGSDALLVPDRIDLGDAVPMTPFVRARWRIATGLPRTLVVSINDDGASVSDESVPTALAIAAAVIATGRRLVEALAWAAPCVTDAASADAAGARDGVDVLIADEAEAGARARALVVDERQAAALSRAGRRLVERRHDQHRPLRVLTARLDLEGGPRSAADRLERRLGELWTPTAAPIRRRAAAAIS